MDMKSALPPGMFDATRLTHAGRLTEAAAALQQMLRGQVAPGSVYSQAPSGPSTIDGMAEKAGATEIKCATRAEPMPKVCVAPPPLGIAAGTMHPTMPDGLRGFFGQVGHNGLQVPGGKDPSPGPSPVAVPDGAQFLAAQLQRPGGEPSLQALRAKQLPPWASHSPDCDATRLHPVARRLRCWHAHE